MKNNSVYRADQVGSLHRPKSVLDARLSFTRGELSQEKLTEIEDEAILAAIQKQEQIGFPVVTDGEFRRESFLTNMQRAVSGFSNHKVKMNWRGGDGEPITEGSASVVGAPLAYNGGRMNDHEASFLKANAKKPFKMTVPSASMYADMGFMPGLTDQFYNDPYELLSIFAEVVRDEVQALVDDSVEYVQIDNSTYPHLMDPEQTKGLMAKKLEPKRWLDEAIAADNASIAVKRNETTVFGFHICRGNLKGRWRSQGGYDYVAEKLFNGLNVDRFLLEYDDERSGSFDPLRFVPKGKYVVLGLVTTKDGTLERLDDMVRRVEAASRFVPVEYLAVSPQCGFASVADQGDVMSIEQQWRKLELVLEVANKVWG
jgi:5-methyltetrahydropteroyltriglutamate--homocysteine methyltransferase